MNSVSFKKNLLGVQEELLRFAYKLTADREEANDLLQETSLKALDNEDKYIPDTNFKGWMYTIMRNIFINNYRKIVRDQTFVDHTDNLYHLSMPQDSGFDGSLKVIIGHIHLKIICEFRSFSSIGSTSPCKGYCFFITQILIQYHITRRNFQSHRVLWGIQSYPLRFILTAHNYEG